ncbi:hypothetical protein RZS08_45075, partial [Arthrospira platensis SPKY1]|nr:hypothetical protein [Arthrospira platensis SPKY1]
GKGLAAQRQAATRARDCAVVHQTLLAGLRSGWLAAKGATGWLRKERRARGTLGRIRRFRSTST